MYFVVKIKKELILAAYICVSGCRRELTIENGTVDYELPRLQSPIAIYSCNSGYELVGKKIRTCTLNLAWTGHSPTCQGEFYFYVKLMVTITKLHLVNMFDLYFLDITDNDMPKLIQLIMNIISLVS